MVAQSASRITIALILLLSLGTRGAVSEEILRVYGSEGPSPAIQEAADDFGELHGVRVQVVAGPTEGWMEQAVKEADVVFASAEFQMSAFIRGRELGIDESSVVPLYLRPSAILVRPGNPRAIADFPDLLKPGVRVMVVNGSGQVGLWEDVAGKLGNIETIRSFRKNIALFAASSDEAMRAWSEREDIDAWLTWNIWHIPLKDRADIVPVSRDYRVYRQCSVGLTVRGKAKPVASQFIDFLISPAGARVFESWGWMAPPSGGSPLAVNTDICVAFRVDRDESKDGVGEGLAGIRQLLADYKAIGIAPDEVHITAVVHGAPGYWLLKDGPYARATGKEGRNPNQPIIRELSDAGVNIEIGAQTMKERGWTKDDILPGVSVVPGANLRIIDLELQGYAYMRN